MEEKKVDFLQQIEFLGGWYKYIKKKDCKKEEEMGDFPF